MSDNGAIVISSEARTEKSYDTASAERMGKPESKSRCNLRCRVGDLFSVCASLEMTHRAIIRHLLSEIRHYEFAHLFSQR